MPRWSVIMPVLDGEAYLPATLDSLLRTLPADSEIRIMDDGSGDATPDILQRAAAKDARVRLHRHDRPAGVAASLNELAAAGDSELLARMDADDLALPGRWAQGSALLRRADFAFTPVVFVDERTRPRGIDQPGHLSSHALPLHLMLGCCLVHPTAMMRRAAFDRVGGYGVTKAEDYDLWLRAVAAGTRLVRSTVPGLLYRRHAGQVTVQQPWMAEGTDSTLWGSYRDAAELTLGEVPDGLDEFFLAALHTGPIPASATAAIDRAASAIAHAARAQLGGVDRALLTWRLDRQLRRMHARAAG